MIDAHPSQIQCANMKLYMCATSRDYSHQGWGGEIKIFGSLLQIHPLMPSLDAHASMRAFSTDARLPANNRSFLYLDVGIRPRTAHAMAHARDGH